MIGANPSFRLGRDNQPNDLRSAGNERALSPGAPPDKQRRLFADPSRLRASAWI